MNKITELMRGARYHQDPFLAAFGIQIDNKLARLDGRVLPPPRIEYGSKQGPHGKVNFCVKIQQLQVGKNLIFQPNILIPKDGVWRCDNERFYCGGTANGIGVISFLGGHKDRMAEWVYVV